MGASPARFRLLEDTTRHPLREWAPYAAGLLVGVAAAWLLTPPPASPSVSSLALWVLATRCTIPVFFAAAIAFRAASMLLRAPDQHDTLDIACLATWFPPLEIFFRNGSWPAAIIAAAIAAAGTRAVLVRSWRTGEPKRSVIPGMLIGVLLQITALAVIVNDWRSSAVALSAASGLMVWMLTTRNLWRPQPARFRRIRIVPAILFGVAFSAGGLSSHGSGSGNGAGGGLLGLLLSGSSEQSAPGKSDVRPGGVVIGESYPGVILWPDTEKHVTLVTPLPPARRNLFSGRTVDTLSIPFYGAYWFFRAPWPPRNPFVTHGDPVALSFRSTDFGPLSMEARQNFVRLIDVNCCSSIAVMIRNGDQRSGAVSLELVLRNTTLPGKPSQILGPERVPPLAKNQRPTDERIVFPLRAGLSIHQFDEITVRFLHSWPGADRSVHVAVRRFIFTRRG